MRCLLELWRLEMLYDRKARASASQRHEQQKFLERPTEPTLRRSNREISYYLDPGSSSSPRIPFEDRYVTTGASREEPFLQITTQRQK